MSITITINNNKAYCERHGLFRTIKYQHIDVNYDGSEIGVAYTEERYDLYSINCSVNRCGDYFLELNIPFGMGGWGEIEANRLIEILKNVDIQSFVHFMDKRYNSDDEFEIIHLTQAIAFLYELALIAAEAKRRKEVVIWG